MSQSDIIECVKSIKVKNCEGYDRIPQRILVDGIDHLAKPLTHLFNQIYHNNQLPDQWPLNSNPDKHFCTGMHLHACTLCPVIGPGH